MKIWVIVLKEWAETLRDRMILMSILLLPLVFIGMAAFTVRMPDSGGLKPGTLDGLYALSPGLRAFSPQDLTKMILINQFMMFFLMMPAYIPLTIAVHSVIGEKQNRTLEPLLAAPVTTLQLLLGKALAAAIPAIVITWAAFAIFLGSTVTVVSEALQSVLFDVKWIFAILIISPLLCLLGVALAIVLSSRLNDTRAAQQIGVVFVLPIIGVGVAQTAGRILLGFQEFALGALILVLIDAILLYLVVRVFDRETILTRWK